MLVAPRWFQKALKKRLGRNKKGLKKKGLILFFFSRRAFGAPRWRLSLPPKRGCQVRILGAARNGDSRENGKTMGDYDLEQVDGVFEVRVNGTFRGSVWHTDFGWSARTTAPTASQRVTRPNFLSLSVAADWIVAQPFITT